mmetsp:Transcript_12283/g.28400  ORF Transcript_12283/g.28400 Transcript_12283/m.28400 type:complete len:268 (-) Transcript_12283:35-838(-)
MPTSFSCAAAAAAGMAQPARHRHVRLSSRPELHSEIGAERRPVGEVRVVRCRDAHEKRRDAPIVAAAEVQAPVGSREQTQYVRPQPPNRELERLGARCLGIVREMGARFKDVVHLPGRRHVERHCHLLHRRRDQLRRGAAASVPIAVANELPRLVSARPLAAVLDGGNRLSLLGVEVLRGKAQALSEELAQARAARVVEDHELVSGRAVELDLALDLARFLRAARREQAVEHPDRAVHSALDASAARAHEPPCAGPRGGKKARGAHG